MEMYQKPVMKITELEKVDVLTCSQKHLGIGKVCINPEHSVHTKCDGQHGECVFAE